MTAAGSLVTVVVAATFGANSAVMFVLAADETVATIELRTSARGGHQPTGIAEGWAALIEAFEPLRRFAADLVLRITSAVADVIGSTHVAGIAMLIFTAFYALQTALDAASHQRE